MDELKEIKRRLSILDIRKNGYIKVEDVRSVIDFIEGLIYEKEKKYKKSEKENHLNIV